MSKRFIFIIIALLAAGCTQYTFGGDDNKVEAIDDTVITRELRYLDNNTRGPVYEVVLEVPEEWVGSFETRTRGNSLVFNYFTDDDDETGSPIFFIDALSNAQYWEQIGSFPTQYKNIANTADTYFIYNLPLDDFYSGLPEDEFDDLADAVPAIIESIQVVRRD